MQHSHFLVLLLVAYAASVDGLADDSTLQDSNLKTNSDTEIVNARRNLKGSITTETEDAMTDEERGRVSGILSKLPSAFKGNAKYVKAFETSPAFANAVNKNPGFAKLIQEDNALVKILAKNPVLVKHFEDPAITKALGDALKNPTVLKSFQESKDIQKIIAALPRSGLTNTKIEKIGETMAKSTTVNRGISDEGQQLTAWGAAIVGSIIILLIGLVIRGNT